MSTNIVGFFFSGDLKRICETDLGLISQCCLTKHVFKISKQYLANVSLKINVKVTNFNANRFLIHYCTGCVYFSHIIGTSKAGLTIFS